MRGDSRLIVCRAWPDGAKAGETRGGTLQYRATVAQWKAEMVAQPPAPPQSPIMPPRPTAAPPSPQAGVAIDLSVYGQAAGGAPPVKKPAGRKLVSEDSKEESGGFPDFDDESTASPVQVANDSRALLSGDFASFANRLKID